MGHDTRNVRLTWLTLFAWVVFVAGVLIQVITPRLEVSNGAFVIPATNSAKGDSIRPDEIVANERRKQFVSALLTVSGALALAYRYRHVFVSKA